jgi:hypothetical protein
MRSATPRVVLSSGLALLCASLGAARGASLYDVIDLGRGAPVKINWSRQVLIQDGSDVVLWQDGQRTIVAQGRYALDLNQLGHVLAGMSPIASGQVGESMLYTPGQVVAIENGMALNDLGVVAGFDADLGSFFTWQNGVKTPVGPPGQPWGIVTSLNNTGDFAAMVDLLNPRPILHIDGSLASGITYDEAGGFAYLNESGQAAFSSRTPTGARTYAYTWHDGVTTRVLPQQIQWHLGLPEHIGEFNALNNLGQVVGYHEVLNELDGWGSEFYGGLLYEGGQAYTLNDLLAPQFSSHWDVRHAFDINDRGDIIARAFLDSDLDNPRAVLLRPRPGIGGAVTMPEPSSLALVATGAVLTGGLLHRARGKRRAEITSRPAPAAAPSR